MKRKKKITLIITSVFFFILCGLSIICIILKILLTDIGVTEFLGNGYEIDYNGAIVYKSKPDKHYYTVIVSGVDNYKYNEKWIIARTLGTYSCIEGDSIRRGNYWLIDKRIKFSSGYVPCKTVYTPRNADFNVVISNLGPLDSLSFLKLVDSLNVNLSFDD